MDERTVVDYAPVKPRINYLMHALRWLGRHGVRLFFSAFVFVLIVSICTILAAKLLPELPTNYECSAFFACETSDGGMGFRNLTPDQIQKNGNGHTMAVVSAEHLGFAAKQIKSHWTFNEAPPDVNILKKLIKVAPANRFGIFYITATSYDKEKLSLIIQVVANTYRFQPDIRFGNIQVISVNTTAQAKANWPQPLAGAVLGCVLSGLFLRPLYRSRHGSIPA